MTEEINIGAIIQKLRTKYGLTQEKLAELSDLSTTFISKLERNETNNISLNNLVSLARVFNLSLDELAGFSNLPNDNYFGIHTNLLIKEIEKLDPTDADKLSKNLLEIIEVLTKNSLRK